jgi:hypothetical protein
MPPISKEKNQKIKSGVGAQRKSIVLKREGSQLTISKKDV